MAISTQSPKYIISIFSCLTDAVYLYMASGKIFLPLCHMLFFMIPMISGRQTSVERRGAGISTYEEHNHDVKKRGRIIMAKSDIL